MSNEHESAISNEQVAPISPNSPDRRSERAAELIDVFQANYEIHSLDDAVEAAVKVLTCTDLELLKENNRAEEAARHYELQLRRDQRRVVVEDRLAGLEQFNLKLRLLGVCLAFFLSLSSIAGSVILLLYSMSVAFSLGLIALAAACAGAAFAIATGIPVRPKDFVNMLKVGRDIVTGSNLDSSGGNNEDDKNEDI